MWLYEHFLGMRSRDMNPTYQEILPRVSRCVKGHHICIMAMCASILMVLPMFRWFEFHMTIIVLVGNLMQYPCYISDSGHAHIAIFQSVYDCSLGTSKWFFGLPHHLNGCSHCYWLSGLSLYWPSYY